MEEENKTVPASIGAERAILGKVLEDSNLFEDIASQLKVLDFYFYEHQLIFSTMLDLDAIHKAISIASVSDRLNERGQLDAAGGKNHLEDLLLDSPPSADLEPYVKIIRANSVRRQLIKDAEKIREIAFYPAGRVVEEILDEAEQKIFTTADNFRNTKESGLRDINDFVLQNLDYIELMKKNGEALTGFSTGLDQLDEKTLGLQRGDLIIIAARPSMGKTALALNMGWSVSKNKKLPIAIFSLEMPGNSLTMRMLSSLSGIGLQFLKKGNIPKEHQYKFRSTLIDLYNSKIFINDNPSVTLGEIRADCRRLKKEHGDLGLVILDYIQLVQLAGEDKNNRAALIADLSRGLKLLARDLDVPVIALSQLNRSIENRADKRPQMSDIRESGAIEQDADLILFIYREYLYTKREEDSNKATIIIGKQRNGPIGSFEVCFDGDTSSFKNEIPLTENRDYEDEEDNKYYDNRNPKLDH